MFTIQENTCAAAIMILVTALFTQNYYMEYEFEFMFVFNVHYIVLALSLLLGLQT